MNATRSKRRAAVSEVIGETTESVVLDAGRKADRQYQSAEADVPEGWELLPAMPGRTIRANRKYLDSPNPRKKHAPWKVSDGEAGDVFAYEVRPVGEVRFMVGVAVDESGCSVGTAWVETDGPLLVRRV